MTKFLTSDLWPILAKLSKRSKVTKIAVAYFGTGASKLLTFKKGDTLIVAMGIGNVIAGQTNPFEVEKLMRRGVHVFNLPNLHSKIFIFDNTVIVGSSNISSRSKDYLIEAGIATNDTSTLRDANAFIQTYAIERIEQDYIEVCKPKYNPPKLDAIRASSDKSTSKFKGNLSRLFVISTKKTDWKDSDYAAVDADRELFSKKIVNPRVFEVNEIKYDLPNDFINSVRDGDLLIEIETHKVKAFALFPKRALGITRVKNQRIAFLRTEELKTRKTIPWSLLKTELLRNGIKGISKNSTKEIKNENTKRVLLEIFNAH